MDVYQIAKTCHEVNKVFCESIGDFSQLSWDDAPQWQKDSAINGVTFHLENPYSKPCDSHNNWMDEKLKEGWKYGAVKNPEIKEHPCMVEYDELPKDQQTKDALFVAIVHSHLSYDEIPDSSMLSTYKCGFEDELSGFTKNHSMIFQNINFAKAYNLGRMDAIVGDDVRSVDYQSDDEKLERIRQSNLYVLKLPDND